MLDWLEYNMTSTTAACQITSAYQSTAGVFLIKVWPRHSAPLSAALAEETGRAPHRTDYKLALLIYKCLKGVAPLYLADDLCQTADVEARCRLSSASSPSLVVRRTRLSTYGDRAFPVAASRVWNSLPHHVTSAQSLPVFRSRLKTHLFQTQFSLTILLCSWSDTRHYGHVNRCLYLLTYYTKSPSDVCLSSLAARPAFKTAQRPQSSTWCLTYR